MKLKGFLSEFLSIEKGRWLQGFAVGWLVGLLLALPATKLDWNWLWLFPTFFIYLVGAWIIDHPTGRFLDEHWRELYDGLRTYEREQHERERRRLRRLLRSDNLTEPDVDAIWLLRRRCAFVWWLRRGVRDAICDVGNHILSAPQGYLISETLVCNTCAERMHRDDTHTDPEDVDEEELAMARESARFSPCNLASVFDRALYGEISNEGVNAVRAFWRHCAFVAALFDLPLDMPCAKCKRERPTAAGYLNLRWRPPLPEYQFFCSECIDQVLSPESFHLLDHMEESELEFIQQFAQLKCWEA